MVSKKVQLVKVCAAKPDDLSSIPGTHIKVEGDDLLQQVVL